MATLLEKCNEIKNQKDLYIKPENLRKDVVAFGVTGELEEGIDTTDATAAAGDIAAGKTAYVNNEKVTGSIKTVADGDIWNMTARTTVDFMNNGALFKAITTFPEDILFRGGSRFNGMMASTDVAEASGLTSDILLKGNTVLGIEGTAEIGIDTNDATATEYDLIEGQTAYARGDMITGMIPKTYDYYMPSHLVEVEDSSIRCRVETDYHSGIMLEENATISLDGMDIAFQAGLTEDILLAGNTVLGIEGSAQINSAPQEPNPILGDVCVFSSESQMEQNSAAEGSLAMIYSSYTGGLTAEDTFSKAIFPETVSLPSEIMDYSYIEFELVDASKSGSAWINLDSHSFDMMVSIEEDNYQIRYDNMHETEFTRSVYTKNDIDIEEEEVDFGVLLKIADPSNWNDIISYFITITTSYFGGIYKRENDSWIHAANQLTANDSGCIVPGLTAYGANGIITGDSSIYNKLDPDEMLVGFVNKGAEAELIELTQPGTTSLDAGCYGLAYSSLAEEDTRLKYQTQVGTSMTYSTDGTSFYDEEWDKSYILQATTPNTLGYVLQIWDHQSNTESIITIAANEEYSNSNGANAITKIWKYDEKIYFSVNSDNGINILTCDKDNVFEVYTTIELDISNGGALSCTLVDEDNNLYLSAIGVGIIKYNLEDGSYVNILSISGTPTSNIYSGNYHSNKCVIYTDANNQISFYDIVEQVSYPMIEKTGSILGCSFDVGDNTYFFVHLTNVFYKFNRETKTVESITVTPYQRVNRCFPLTVNKSIVATGRALLDVDTFTFYDYSGATGAQSPGCPFKQILTDSDFSYDYIYMGQVHYQHFYFMKKQNFLDGGIFAYASRDNNIKIRKEDFANLFSK